MKNLLRRAGVVVVPGSLAGDGQHVVEAHQCAIAGSLEALARVQP